MRRCLLFLAVMVRGCGCCVVLFFDQRRRRRTRAGVMVETQGGYRHFFSKVPCCYWRRGHPPVPSVGRVDAAFVCCQQGRGGVDDAAA